MPIPCLLPTRCSGWRGTSPIRRWARCRGNVRVGNVHNILTAWQSLEYTTSQNFDRRGYDLLNCITVVPGAVGAMRRQAVMAVGGYTHDTLAEDTDLTWKLRRAGWRIVNDNTAMAYTEAPETLRNLAKQRFRWAFGTLQCLWKHRAALWNDGAFGWLALPSLWVYQILFPAISPFMDVAMVCSLFSGNFGAVRGLFLRHVRAGVRRRRSSRCAWTRAICACCPGCSSSASSIGS